LPLTLSKVLRPDKTQIKFAFVRGLFVPLLRSMPKLYIIAGCNGAGKTTASYTVLPEMLGCREFVNADEIAKGLSPFNPESVAIEAGRLMLQRMDDLLSEGEDFAFETTLATRSYVKFVERVQAKGYFVTLLYFWLPTPEQAIERVATRVSEGGHNIPSDVIRRRYANGIKNLTTLYTPICDYWIIYDNSVADGIHKVAWGVKDEIKEIVDPLSYQKIVGYERD
jgi:predicted ABC-type ATPase